MCKLVIALFWLSSVFVCDSHIVKDYEPVATSYSAREDGPAVGNNYGYGYAKKNGYNKMIFTTYLGPASEEVAASYSSYIIHPVDNKRCGYDGAESKPSEEVYIKVPEDSAEMSTFLKMFPIIVAESNKGDEPVEELKTELKEIIVQDDNTFNDENNDLDGEWFVKEGPNGNYIIDDETEQLYKAWLEEEDPKLREYWKNFKQQFDSFYEDKYKQLFGVDNAGDKYIEDDEDDEQGEGDNDDEDDEEDEEEDEDDKDDDHAWYDEIPYKYKDEGTNYVHENNNWNPNDVHKPKSQFGNNNVNNYNYGWMQRW